MTFRKLASDIAFIALGLALLAGVVALVTDRRATAREAAAMAAYPPEGQFIDVGGARVHAVVRGAGPDLVLIHGASGSARDFTFDLMDRLAADFRVIAFDRPGMGWSDPHPDAPASPVAQAETLRAAAQSLGVRRPILVGHSYGGAVAMAWAVGAPAPPAAIVLLAGATHPWPGDLGLYYSVLTSWAGQHMLIPLITAFGPRAQAVAVAEGIFEPQSPPPGYTDHIGITLSMRRDTLRLNALQVGGLKPHVAAMSPRYAALEVPIEIVHGTRDTIVGISFHSERMVAEVPGARLTRLEGIGHMPHHAATEAVLAAIARAATRADQARPTTEEPR
jgi:pimeloyl-ACP methyl ester carboxylesterase